MIDQDKNYKSYTINMIENFVKEDKKGNKKTYIVLDYIKNKSLYYVFEKNQKTFPIKCVKYLFSKILKGVQEIHNSRLCHLDLKLDNILLDEKFNPIICDFGFCMDSSQRITKYLYSPGYAPKEIFQCRPFDGIKADIFSLGVILFKLVTNKSIFYDIKPFNYTMNEKGFKDYINIDDYYKYIKDKKFDDFWKVAIGDELNSSKDFKYFQDLVNNMIAYEPKERYSLDKIINHPWLEEVNHLTDEEKKQLDDNVEKEIIEILTIKNQKNDDNSTNKNCTSNETEITNNNKSYKNKDDIFTEDFELDYIDENNLDMTNYFKINGSINPRKLMNLLYYELDEFKANKNDNRTISISKGEGFEIDIKFESDNEEIIEEFKKDGIEKEDYEDFLKLLI